MTFENELISTISTLQETNKSIFCNIFTDKYVYTGFLECDKNGVTPEDFIVLKDARVSTDIFNQTMSFDKAIIRLDSIKSFFYSVK